MIEARQREALRQQMLLRALLGDARPAVVEGWLGGDAARKRSGLLAYRANAGALAERALAAAVPTVAQLLGDTSFAGFARAFWQAHPPTDGDLANWGDELPAFIERDAQLASEPYLADVARIDLAVQRAERAADDSAPPQGLEQLAQHDPARLRLRLRAGWWVLPSAHPVHAIWTAHRSADTDSRERFAPVRQALADGRHDAVRVRRSGWQAAVDLLAADTARFEQAVLQGRSLGLALEQAGPAFDFEPWLIAALRLDALAAVQPFTGDTP